MNELGSVDTTGERVVEQRQPRLLARLEGGLSRSDGPYACAVFVTFIVAMFLRLGGIPHVEPILFHPDEPDFVIPALRMLRSGSLHPGWFAHPGTLTIYNLSLVYATDAGLRGVDSGTLLAEYALDPTPFHVLGKYVMVAWSMVELLGLWFLTRHFMSRWPSLLAVLLLALAPLDVTLSTTIRTDTQQSAILLFVCLFAVRAVVTGRRSWLLLSGLTLGFATAVKWPAVAASPAIALAALLMSDSPPFWRPQRRQLVSLLLAALASCVGLFLATPHAFFDYQTVLSDVAHEARARDLGPTNSGVLDAIPFYLEVLRSTSSVAVLVFAALGATAGLRSALWRPCSIVVMLWSVYGLFIGVQSVHWSRWAVPLLPYVCLLATLGVTQCCAFLGRRLVHRGPVLALSAGLVALIVLPLTSNIRELLADRARGDASVKVTQWIAQHVPRGSSVLTERAAPYLPGGMFDVFVSWKGRGRLERAKSRSRYYVPAGQVGYLKDVEAALRNVDYVVLGNYQSRIKAHPAGHERELRVYKQIQRSSNTVFKLGSYRVLEVKKDDP